MSQKPPFKRVAPKPRDPASHLRSQGALRVRTIPDKKKPDVRSTRSREEFIRHLTRETGHD